jgi:hypothetical protein
VPAAGEPRWVTLRARWVTFRARSLGDAESSLGDAKSSLDDAESSLGDAKSSLGDYCRGSRARTSTRRVRWARRARRHGTNVVRVASPPHAGYPSAPLPRPEPTS